MRSDPVHQKTNPEARARELNEISVRMIERHEPASAIHAVRKAYLAEKMLADRIACRIPATHKWNPPTYATFDGHCWQTKELPEITPEKLTRN